MSLEVTGYVSHIYGGTKLFAIDPADPFRRVHELHPDRLTEDRTIMVRCACASTPPTLGTERSEHLETCPFSVLSDIRDHQVDDQKEKR